MKLYVYLFLAFVCILINSVMTPAFSLSNIIVFAPAVVTGVLIKLILEEMDKQ